MSLGPVQVSLLVDRELETISQADLVSLIRQLRITPRREVRDWDYGRPGEAYPCWIVLEHHASNTGVAYCEHGFGPGYPWGLVFLSGQYMSIGLDCSWFASLEDAMRNCQAWEGSDPPGYEIQ